MSPAGALRVLVVDDEAPLADTLARALARRGFETAFVTSGKEAIERATREPFDVVVTDLKMRPPDGLEVLRQVRKAKPEMQVILMTAYPDTKIAVKAMQEGAYDFLTKEGGVDLDELALRLERVARERAGHAERETLRGEVSALRRMAAPIVGESSALREALLLLEKVAPTSSTVLLWGETGTGKDLFARAVHALSPRAGSPWVKVNCGALPEQLMESELFGHERGAFTGAVARKIGRFEQADKGTIFLDEVGELTLALQVKLLQVLEEKSFVRVGGTETITVDVRVVAATNRDLSAEVAKGSFREDLFFRLNVFPIRLPTLRERPGDVAALIGYFLARAGASPDKLTPEARAALEGYSFPGNVRELEHILERALIIAGSDPVTVGQLDLSDRRPKAQVFGVPDIPDEGLSLETLERELILKALEKAAGNKSQAARLLGLTRRTLYSRMEKHGLRAPSGAGEEDAEDTDE
ncbi:MAG TPA: sigma-54 dependent transcriptional regulator [Candidatus Eisenbacteria bacterium]|nr:sigma-54 dependent transcriptional regulator [Candidatus Eisenbacteria bacterium]